MRERGQRSENDEITEEEEEEKKKKKTKKKKKERGKISEGVSIPHRGWN